MNARPQHQRGVALLVALLVVALAVILIAALLDRGELALARTRNVLRSEQAEAYAQGLEIYAAQILLTTSGQADTNVSPWALPLPPQPVPGGIISATMHDMNGCFNLNNMAANGGDPLTWVPLFANLLKARGVIDPALPIAVRDWLSATPNAGDDNTYLAQPIPYRPAHRAFAHVSELRLVRGFDGDVYAKVAPYLCALPAGTRININTASVPVLQSLGISQSAAESLWNNGQAHFNGLEDLPAGVGTTLPKALLDVKSSFFLARGDIVLDDVPFTFYSLIERGNGLISVISVIERSRGSDDALIAPAPIAAAPAHAGAPK
ncbi:MAG: type II secretion system minor pseudopilin GspK [Dokdonella sp.]